MNIKDRLITSLLLVQYIFQLYFVSSFIKLHHNKGNIELYNSLLNQSSVFILCSCVVFGIVIWRLLILRNKHISLITSKFRIYDRSMKTLSKGEIFLFSGLSANPGFFFFAILIIVNNLFQYRKYALENLKENNNLKNIFPGKLVPNIYFWMLIIFATMFVAFPFLVYKLYKMYNISIAQLGICNEQMTKHYGYSLLDEMLYFLYSLIALYYFIHIANIDTWLIGILKSF